MNSKKTLKLLLATIFVVLLATSCGQKKRVLNKYFDEDIDKTQFCEFLVLSQLNTESEVYKNILEAREESVKNLSSATFVTKTRSRASAGADETYGEGVTTFNLYKDGIKEESESTTKRTVYGTTTTSGYSYLEEKANGEDRYYWKVERSSENDKELIWGIGEISDYSEEFYHTYFDFKSVNDMFYFHDVSRNTIVTKTDEFHDFTPYGSSEEFGYTCDQKIQTLYVFDTRFTLKEMYTYFEDRREDKSKNSWDVVNTKSLSIVNLKYGDVENYPNKEEFLNSVPNDFVQNFGVRYSIYGLKDDQGQDVETSFMFNNPIVKDFDNGKLSKSVRYDLTPTDNDLKVRLSVNKSYLALKESLEESFVTKTYNITKNISELYDFDVESCAEDDDVYIIVHKGETFNLSVTIECDMFDNTITIVR